MRGMHLARIVVLVTTCFFSYIVLAVNAAYLGITFTAQLDDGLGLKIWPATSPDPFAVVNIFVALLTLVLVKPIIIIDFCRQNAFTSMILTELGVLGILNIFWVVAAGYTTNIFSSLSTFCSDNKNIGSVASACADGQVSLAFSWLNWIMLLAYGVTLLTYAIIYANKGAPVWNKSVRFVSRSPAVKPAAHGKSADYYQASPAAPLTQAAPALPPVQMQAMAGQPQIQTYDSGSTMYPPPPAGLAYGVSPLRAEV